MLGWFCPLSIFLGVLVYELFGGDGVFAVSFGFVEGFVGEFG